MPNNIAVSITADVADLQVKRAVMSAELKAATADLNAFAKSANTGGMTDGLKASMLTAADAATKARNSIKLIDTEMKTLGGGHASPFAAMVADLKSATLQEGASKLGPLSGAITALGPAGLAAAAGLSAMAFAAKKAVEGAEWAEGLKRAAATLGFTTTQLQEFDFAFNAMGIDVEKGRETLSGLEKTIGLVTSGLARSMQVKAFTDSLKISPADLRGWGTLEEQLPHILDSLAKLEPEQRSAIAMRLKIDPEVLTSMIEGRDRLAGLIQEAHEYGIVISADVIDKSAESAGKMREWKAAIDGELRTAFIELAPVIAGAAHTVASAARDFADFVKGVHHVVGEVGGFVTSVENAVAPVFRLGGALKGLAADVDFVMNPLSIVIDKLKELGHAETAGADRVNTLRDQMLALVGKQDKPAELSPPKAKKKKGGNDEVEQWREQLHAQEVASNDFFKDNTTTELAFWQSKLALTKQGSKQWLSVQSEIFNLSKTLARQDLDEHMAALDAKAAGDRDSWSKYRADLQAELDLVKSTQGQESAAYQHKFREIEQAEREHQIKLAESAAQADQHAITALKNHLDAQMSILETQANSARALNAEKGRSSITGPLGDVSAAAKDMASDRQLAQQKLANELAMNAAMLAADQNDIDRKATLYKGDVTRYQSALDKKLDDEQKFYDKIALMQAQMVARQQEDLRKIRAAWHGAIDPLVNSFGTGVKGMINGTETLSQALRGVGDTIEGVIITAIERWIAAQIVAMILGKTVGLASAQSQVATAAALAGANGVASMAAAPFPLDLGAPAFGGAMFAAATAFGKFDKGMDVVPQDMIAQVHAGERIVPKSDNSQIMAAVGAGSGGAGSRGGDTHIHHTYSPTINGEKSRDIVKALEAQSGDFVRLLKGLHRGNKLAFAK